MSEDLIDQPPPPPGPPSGEDWPARIEELLGEAEAAASVAERCAVLCRIAEIYERRLGDPNGALVTLQAALGIATLVHQVPIGLALAHQGLAMVVLALAVVHAQRLAPRGAEQPLGASIRAA